jgi:hypothetical protein
LSTVSTTTAVPTLAELAETINAAHEAGEKYRRKGLENYRRCGKALLKAKRQVGHGQWLKWLKDNIRFTIRRAQQYMELAKCEVTSHLEGEWQRISGNVRREDEDEAEHEPAAGPAGVLLRALRQVQAGLPDKADRTADWRPLSPVCCLGEGNVYTLNGDTACQCPSGLDKTILGFVRADVLVKLLEKLTAEDVTIGQERKGLTLSGQGFKAVVAMTQEAEFPEVMAEEPGEWRNLPPDFIEALKLVGPCASSDPDREELAYVHLTPELMEACSGIQACRCHLKTGLAEETLVKWASLKPVVHRGMNEWSETGKWLHFRSPAGLIVSARKQHAYDYENLDEAFAVDGQPLRLPAELARLVGPATVFSRYSDENYVTVELEPGRVRVRSESVFGRFKGWSKKVAYDGEPFSFRIEPNLLTKIVRRFGDRIIASKRRLLVQGDDWVYVVGLQKTQQESEDSVKYVTAREADEGQPTVSD